ncbi:hypothetical protein F511_23206 [Dorcoceras hygrometricum]|uniref:Uncharacterized protein n=1 Tax=Dorcoceras hygrometricum TaxID=472368 RepID=A0A2Z7B6W2_9LAMI|nr:hypothetical protein F511_23206 [Dorcoceras hygrometricum]
MRIRPPEIETSICDAKYHVTLIETRKKALQTGHGAAGHGGAPPRARSRAMHARWPRMKDANWPPIT